MSSSALTLEETVRARDEVLAHVAHDLRGPLQTIMFAADAIRDSDTDDTCREGARILRAALRMNRLIDDLLLAARVKAGVALPLECELVEPTMIVETVLEIHARQAAAKNITLRGSWRDGMGEIWADGEKLTRVLSNLVGNAIKFTQSGGCVEVALKRVHGEIVFTVADNGPGIAGSDMPHIFDAHWQKERDGRGCGLGLAIARSIVAAHGGQLSATSVVGHGATFAVALPLLRA